MKDLIWKKGLPEKPGWYWRKTPSAFGEEGVEQTIVCIRDYAGDLAIGNSTIKGWSFMEQAEWAGPIPNPLTP